MLTQDPTRPTERGAAHILLALLVVMIVAAAALAVYNYNLSTHKTNSATVPATSPAAKPANLAQVVSPEPTVTPLPTPSPTPTPTPPPPAPTPSGTATGQFEQSAGGWPAGQSPIYIGVGTTGTVSKVEWYLNSEKASALYATASNASAGSLYQLDWDWKARGFKAGTYRWYAKIYDSNGNYQWALYRDGATPYLQTSVSN